MYLPNNPNIDLAALENRVRQVAKDRRRDHALLTGDFVSVPALGGGATLQQGGQGWRARVKRIPLLGPFAVSLNRFLVSMRMPGLGWKQKVRLIPVLGPMVFWAYGLLKFNGIRAQFTHDIAGLQQQQAALQREVRELRATMDALAKRRPEASMQTRAGSGANALDLDGGRGEGGLRQPGEALTYLQAQPGNSIDVLTGLRFLAGLTPEQLAQTLDASLRVLRPGGLALFASSQPENLQSAAGAGHGQHSPDVVVVLATQRGFAAPDVLRLTRSGDADGSPQDYVVILRKPHAH